MRSRPWIPPSIGDRIRAAASAAARAAARKKLGPVKAGRGYRERSSVWPVVFGETDPAKRAALFERGREELARPASHPMARKRKKALRRALRRRRAFNVEASLTSARFARIHFG